MDLEPQQWVGGPTENMSDEKEAVTRPLGILEELAGEAEKEPLPSCPPARKARYTEDREALWPLQPSDSDKDKASHLQLKKWVNFSRFTDRCPSQTHQTPNNHRWVSGQAGWAHVHVL